MTSPFTTTLPPPALTNPLTPLITPLNNILTEPNLDLVAHQPQRDISTGGNAKKVSNVPAVFVPPSYVNRPASLSDSLIIDADAADQATAPHSSRSRLTGSTLTRIPHMHDSNAPHLEMELSNDDLQFDLRPSYNGTLDQPIVYLNAQDVAWYRQVLPNPVLRVWILIKNTSFVLNTANNVGYVKRRLVECAIRNNIQITLMNPNKFDLSVSSMSGSGSVVYNGQNVALPDAVIPRVGANVDYLGLAVLRQLEACGILVFNPVNSIEISRDKLYTHQVLAAHGVPIPKSMLSRYPIEYDYIEQHFTYPLVLKLASGSRGEAVWLCESRQALQDLVENDTAVDKTKPIIVQEFLAATKGRDLRCLVIGDHVVATCMRVSASSFKANFHAGGSVLPVDISPELADMAVRAAKLCGLTFSGVDILMGDDTYMVCEVNSSPGFEGLEKATQVDCAQAMLNHVISVVNERRAQFPSQTVQQWRAQEKKYPLQDDHLEIIRQVKAEALSEQRVENVAA